MNQELMINTNSIGKTDINMFAYQSVLRLSETENEYLVANRWVRGNPGGKPEGKRIVFKNIDTFRNVRDVYFAWYQLNEMKQCNPEFPQLVISRMMLSRVSNRPLVLFTPWGVRTSGKMGPEMAVLNIISTCRDRLEKRNIPTRVVIMPADLYATEINRFDAQVTQKYFDTLAIEIQKRQMECIPWSAIRKSNFDQYIALSTELTDEAIEHFLQKPILASAFSAAASRSSVQIPDAIRKSSLAYLRERICEAVIVEQTLSPVKVSAAAPNKDNKVDMDIPRVYIIPKELQFSWLK